MLMCGVWRWCVVFGVWFLLLVLVLVLVLVWSWWVVLVVRVGVGVGVVVGAFSVVLVFLVWCVLVRFLVLLECPDGE